MNRFLVLAAACILWTVGCFLWGQGDSRPILLADHLDEFHCSVNPVESEGMDLQHKPPLVPGELVADPSRVICSWQPTDRLETIVIDPRSVMIERNDGLNPNSTEHYVLVGKPNWKGY